MKTRLPHAALLLFSMFSLHSCSTNSVLSRTQLKADIVNSKEDVAGCFVVLNDGSMEEYKTLELVTGPFKSPYLLADGKKHIKASEITSYQNKKHFAVNQRTFICGRKSYVASETLPGFAIRIVKGKMNIYVKKYTNGQVAADEFYLQSGKYGMIQPYSEELMSAMVKDNKEAYWYFNTADMKGHLPEKIKATAEIYNGHNLLTRN